MPKGIGILGDSLSDEYQADDARGGEYAQNTYNWVEQIAIFNDGYFGDWGERDEPRRSGYAFNWARSNATSETMITSGQHTGLAEQIKSGEVDMAIIYIGANDFAPYNVDGYQAIYDGSISDARLQEKINTIVVNITTAVETLREAGDVQILLIQVPDWNNHATTDSFFPDKKERQRVTNAIIQTNKELEQMAVEKNIPTVDPNSFFSSLKEKSEEDAITIDEQEINTQIPSNDPSSLFLNDDIHPGTVFSGLFANHIMGALRQEFDISFEEFSASEILKHAGL